MCFVLALLTFSCSSHNVVENIAVENILLVNAGKGEREGLADLINKVRQFQPKVIAIDFQFSSEKSPEADNKLVDALNKCQNLVMVSVIDDYSPDRLFQEKFKPGCLPKFTRNAKTGFANLMVEDDDLLTLKRFSQWEYVNGKEELSFAMQTAYQYDSVKTNSYMLTHENFNDVNFEKGLIQVRRFSIADFLNNQVSKADVEDKIVMIGFLGPGNEDKFYAPIAAAKGPNIYGLEFHAQVVSQVLEE